MSSQALPSRGNRASHGSSESRASHPTTTLSPMGIMPMAPISQTYGKLGLLGALYLSQGLPYGFFTQAMPALMRQQGLSLSLIGLSSLLALPWAFKFAWAPYVDRYGSRRRWILTLQSLTIGAMLLLSLFELKSGLALVFAGFLIANLLAATQDIATDGLAVDMLTPAERGLGNGVQVAGYRVGMIVGGGVLLIAFQWLGWTWTFVVMASLLALATWPILRHQEPERVPATTPLPAATSSAPAQASKASDEGALTLWRGFLSANIGWVGVILLYKAGDALATGMLRPFLVDLGLDLAAIGWLLGTVGFTTGLLGALAGGWTVQRVGRRQALLGFGLLQAIAVGAYALLALGYDQMWMLYLVCGFEHFAGGMATAALFTIMMDRCREGLSATDYTLQASLAVLSKGTVVAFSGFSASTIGFAAHFGMAGLVSLLGVALAWYAIQHAPHNAKT